MSGIQSVLNAIGNCCEKNDLNQFKHQFNSFLLFPNYSRKEVRIVVDSSLKAEGREPPGPFRAINLTSEMIIGAKLDNREGFVGCIRALLLNGKLIDLKSYAQRELYGISTDCIGRCDSNPCLNNGTCHERYDGYSCDCRWSSFKGPICADGSYDFFLNFFI